jgi:hypothetical protein
MEIPESKRTEEEFRGDIQKHVDENYHYDEEHQFYRCNACELKIVCVQCYVSIHWYPWERCAGGGEVKIVQVPYCPTCEGEPKKDQYGGYHACWHE